MSLLDPAVPECATTADHRGSSCTCLKTYEPLIQQYGTWFSSYPWQAYCTGTYRSKVSLLHAEDTFRTFRRVLESRLKCRFAYIAVPERTTSGLGMPPGSWHWHFVLCGPDRMSAILLDCARLLWTEFYGNAHILPFESKQGGARYLAKTAAQVGFDFCAGNLDYLPRVDKLDLFEQQQVDPYVPDHVRFKLTGQTVVLRSCKP